MSRFRILVLRAAKLLLGLLLLLSAAVYLLFIRREHLPPAPPHARVPAEFAPVPGLSVCWIEMGSSFTSFPFAFTSSVLLVRHPAGAAGGPRDLLIDAGISSKLYEEIQGLPWRRRVRLHLLLGRLYPQTPLPGLLHRIGEDPASLRWVLPSHAHLDHIGGLMDLPDVPVLITREELEFTTWPKALEEGNVIRQHTRKLPAPDAPTLKFLPRPYETFDESYDVYGDGSVVVVPLRGHTPGSVGIFVNLGPGRRLFYAGDSVDDERGFTDRVGKSLLLRGSDNDRAMANQVVSRISQLHELLPGLAILPAHGRSAYLKFFPGGPMSCVSAEK